MEIDVDKVVDKREFQLNPYEQVIRVQKLVGLPPPALELLGRLP